MSSGTESPADNPMSEVDHKRARELFLKAIELDDIEQREMLARIAAEDRALHAEIAELLSYHDAGDTAGPGQLAGLSALLDHDSGDPDPLPEIEGYVVHRRIGEGGMGSVYEAEQLRPVHRSVALKLLKRGLDTRQIVARFQAERQALAMMDHPNIARVFDAGESRSGRPFFAMELVRGEPITEFCDRRGLTPAQRLPLFVAACEAVQHAHQKGIIHRDLKPSNILVESFESRSVVKVIDFGIAKALRPTGAETSHTQLGQLLGTPEYMSPEQADVTAGDVDTRTDVYALGVVLYELLTGALPLQIPSSEPGLVAAFRAIREQQPPRPSTRVSTLGAKAQAIAAERHTDPHSLTRMLRRELDWICLKALDKDRERRYASASELSADIERYLRREPVLAGPPSTLYRMRTFVRRNRLAVGAAAALSAALLLGLIGTSVALLRAQRAETEARQQERNAREVAQFLIDIFATSNPYSGEQKEPTASELLERGAARIDELEGEPEIQASLLRALGQVYSGLGRFDRARPLLERAVAVLQEERGEHDVLVARAALTLAWNHRQSGRFDQAEPLLRRSIEVLEASASNDEGPLAAAHMYLGIILRDRADLEPARHHLERSLELREQMPEHDATAMGYALYHLGWLENLSGRYREAEGRYRQTLDLWTAALGNNNPTVGWAHNDLGVVLWNQQRLDEARLQLERALEIQEQTLGPDHVGLSAPLQNYANLLGDMGRNEEALAQLQRVLEIREATYGPEHPEVGGTLGAMAFRLRVLRRYEEALRYYDRSGDIFKRTHGEDSADYAEHLNNVAGLMRDMGNREQSLTLISRALAIQERVFGTEHPQLAFTLTNLAVGSVRAGAYDVAARHFERALDIRRKAIGDTGPVAWTLCRLGDTHALRGAENEAVAAFESAAEILARLDRSNFVERETELGCLVDHARSAARFADRERAVALLEQAEGLTDRESKLLTDNIVQMRASVWALLGERERTLTELRRAIDLGYDPSKLVGDTDFESVRGDPDFEALLAAGDG